MPSVSRAEQRLMGAAEHGATFPLARRLRETMSHRQLHDFASGSMAGKPNHVRKKKSPLAHRISALRGAGSFQGRSRR